MKYFRPALLLFLVCAVCCNGAASQSLVLTTEHYPPFNIVDAKTGAISGISTEKVLELMRRSGEKYTLNAYPWARSFQMASNDPNACIFSISRTAEREPLFKWVGTLAKSNWVIFARSDDRRQQRSLADVRPFVLGTYRNDAIDKFLSSAGFKTDLANSDNLNPEKLLRGRFDFWATEEGHGKSILKAQNLSEKIVPLFQFHQSIMYLACNKSMAQGRVDKLMRVLQEMEDDGTSAAIERNIGTPISGKQ
jgi:polar amino acid transport system substrate-binding protein